jgi:hypothetical protein
MNGGCEIEHELLRVQAAHAEEHLPLEKILEALHEAEVNPAPFLRRIDVPSLGAYPSHP